MNSILFHHESFASANKLANVQDGISLSVHRGGKVSLDLEKPLPHLKPILLTFSGTFGDPHRCPDF